jgi:PAS domain S-box-containing protein
MAMVSLVDGKRQWSKSHHGLAAQEMPREVAMCAYAIRSTERVFEVPDAKADQRFASSALVAGAAQVRFYAGAPLVNVEGYALGTLCVMDHRPGQLDHQGRYVLAALAEQVVAQLELRRTSDHLQRRLSEESTLKERLQEEFDAALESERTVRDQLDAQRQFMQQVMDVLPSVVYVYDCQARRNVFVNPEVVNALGHAPSAVQAVDDPIKAYMHPDDAVRFVDHLQELFKLEQMQVAEISYRMRHADGSWRWFHSREAVLKQADGGPGCQIVGSATDITASKTAAEAMRASEERFRALAELSTVGIGGTDDRGLVLYVNARAAEIIGLPAAECLGKGWTQTLHPGDRPRMMAGWAAALTARQPFCAEFRFQHADGTVVHVLGETRPLPTYRQCETSAVVTLVDLTTVRELELSRRAQEVAEQASKAKNNFVARMSHEMRTPLNGILGFAQLLQVGSVEPSSPRQAQYAGYIEQAGRHLLALIDETLDLARIECGGITLTLQPVPLHDVARECLTLVEGQARSADVTTELLAPADGVWAFADPLRTKEVLLNLLTNAIKYNRPEGRVTVTLAEYGQRVWISVEDTGRGLTLAQVQQLFEPFNRLGAERSKVPGFGLGLAITKQFTEAMGGHIAVQSEPGSGTTFRLDLPKGTTIMPA